MAAPFTPTVRCTYQGVPCLYGEYENPQGVTSGRGFVVMTQENFGQLRINGDPWTPIPAGAISTTDRRSPGGPVPPMGAGFQIRGDLVFESGATPALVL